MSIPSGDPCSGQCDRRSGTELNFARGIAQRVGDRSFLSWLYSWDTICFLIPIQQEVCLYPYDIPPILACLLVHSEQWKEVSFHLPSNDVGCRQGPSSAVEETGDIYKEHGLLAYTMHDHRCLGRRVPFNTNHAIWGLCAAIQIP